MIEFIVEEGGGTRRVELESVPVHIGRAEEAEICLDNDRCSRHHARVQLDGRELIIMDLDSSNGTFLNGERVRRARLRRGDRVDVGDAVLTFVGGEAPVPPTATPHPEIPGYTVLDEQGDGVLSHVLMARQDALGRKVAIKVLREEWRGSKAIVTRFQRQARQQSKLHHHGLASGIDVGEAGGVPYFVVEYLEGDTVGARVRSAMSFEVDRALPILNSLLEVVAWIHEQGHTIENLHPEGVVIGDQGEVWLTSVGFPLPAARSMPDAHATELLYVAPEAVTEPSGAGPRADVFAVGALAVFLLTGRPPRGHDGDAASAARSAAEPIQEDILDGRKLPAPVKAWILRLLSTDPAARPADGGAALRELEGLTEDLEQGAARLLRSAQAAEERVADGPVSFRRSKRFILVNRAITICIGVALNVGFFVWWTGRDEGGGEPEKPQIQPTVQDTEDVAGPSRPGVPGGGGVVDEATAEAEWNQLRSDVDVLLGKDRFSEGLVVATAYTERFAGSQWAQRGVDLVAEIQRKRLERAGQVLDRFEDLIAAGNLDDARDLRSQARAMAADVAADRLRELEDRLQAARVERRRLDAKADAARGGSGKPDPGKPDPGKPDPGKPDPGKPDPGKPDPGKPKASDPFAPSRWPKLVERALTRPAQQELRTKLLALAAQAVPEQLGDLAPRVRWMRAVDLGIADLRAAWSKGVGSEISVAVRGGESPTVEGILKAVHDDRLVIEVGGAAVDVSLDRVSPGAMARMLSVLPPNLDRYLALAGLHLAAREGDEAWFDLQGALLLAKDDALARSVAEAELERLRRSPPRRRRGK